MSDLAGFLRLKEEYITFWISLGVFFILDKIELIILRNLIKKLWLKKGSNPIVDLGDIQKTLNFFAEGIEEFEITEVESIVGNLIFKGFLRGYVFTDQKKLVLSKDNGFPALTKIGVN